MCLWARLTRKLFYKDNKQGYAFCFYLNNRAIISGWSNFSATNWGIKQGISQQHWVQRCCRLWATGVKIVQSNSRLRSNWAAQSTFNQYGIYTEQPRSISLCCAIALRSIADFPCTIKSAWTITPLLWKPDHQTLIRSTALVLHQSSSTSHPDRQKEMPCHTS